MYISEALVVTKSLVYTRGINRDMQDDLEKIWDGRFQSDKTTIPSKCFIQRAIAWYSGNFYFIHFFSTPKRPMRLRVFRIIFIQPADLHLFSRQALPLNYCLEHPVFAFVGSFSTNKFYLNCNGSSYSLIHLQHLSQASRHRLLLSPRSTFPSHSPTNPLTFSGASHKAQCPVLTCLLVKLGINLSMPSDIDGGKALSFVAWIKRTGTLMILFVSLCRLRNLYGGRKKGKGRGNVLQLILEVHFAVAIPVH